MLMVITDSFSMHLYDADRLLQDAFVITNRVVEINHSLSLVKLAKFNV